MNDAVDEVILFADVLEWFWVGVKWSPLNTDPFDPVVDWVVHGMTLRVVRQTDRSDSLGTELRFWLYTFMRIVKMVIRVLAQIWSNSGKGPKEESVSEEPVSNFRSDCSVRAAEAWLWIVWAEGSWYTDGFERRGTRNFLSTGLPSSSTTVKE